MIHVHIVERVFRRYRNNSSSSSSKDLQHRQVSEEVPLQRHETLPVPFRITQITGEDRIQQGCGGYRIIVPVEEPQIQREEEEEEEEEEVVVEVVVVVVAVY